MTRLVLVIEDAIKAGETPVVAALHGDAALACSRISWDDVVRDNVGDESRLIVAVVTALTSKVVEVFEWLRNSPVPSIAVVPADTDESLLGLVARTADDFLISPIRELELRHRVHRMLAEARHDLESVRQKLMDEFGLTTLVGKHPVFMQAIEQLPRFARTDYAVLITGETGTGKELCARALHHMSSRRRYPFIAVDCGAVPEQLFENELFGHMRGAFTDAHRDHRGLIAMAEGGTLLLDEIDALSLPSQAKLLRFLQEHTYRALGSDRFQRADVRVIASTNRDLELCVRERQFRSDLYFRLNILRLHLPPLRERRTDIELLAYHVLNEHGAVNSSAPRSFSAAALRMLATHDWPGNVRELYNIVQRSLVACDGERVLPAHVALVADRHPADSAPRGDFRTARAAVVEAFERQYVEDLLRKHGGNVTRAAREARQDRRAFGRFVKKYRIDRRAI